MRQVLAAALNRSRRGVARTFRGTRWQVADDLRSDPYLPYILLAALVLSSFWIWHLLPNFATRDERWRVVDPVEVLATYLDDPGLGSVSEGVAVWRTYGSAMYLSGLMLVPVVAVAFGTGHLGAFADMGRHTGVGHWRHWLRTPGWIWWWSVLLVRLANVAFAVGSVYVVYRLGTTVRDRATGRLAAFLLAFTWGLLILAHEAGEDVPSLFFFLLAVYLAVRYLEEGTTRLFYLGCFAAAASIAFKFSGGVAVIVLGAAYFLRASRSDEPFAEAVVRPRFLFGALLVGVVTIAVGYPSVLFGAPDQFGGRLKRAVGGKSEPHGWRVKPAWWWILRGYLHGAGLPLSLGFLGGVAATLPRLRERSRTTDALALALVGVGTFLAVYASWEYVRTHHLLPTFALLVVVLAVALRRLVERRPTVGRALVAALVVSTAIYATAGTLGYAAQPRDRANAWLSSHVDDGEVVETYVYDVQESAVPHSASVSYVPGYRMTDVRQRCPTFVELNYHYALSYLAPDDHSEWARRHSNPAKERYVRRLLAEDTYPYEVAATFGRRPRFLDGKEPLPEWRRLLRAGIRPRTIQYGDPQDMGVDQYTVIMRKSGTCTPLDGGGRFS